MRPVPFLLSVLLLAAGPAAAQTGADQPGAANEAAPPPEGMTEVPIGEIPAEEMMDVTVASSDGEEIGRVSSAIPAETGLESILVDIDGMTGVGANSLAFRPEDMTAYRDPESGALRLVTALSAADVDALAATAN